MENNYLIESILLKIIRASELKKINWEKSLKGDDSFKAELVNNNTVYIIFVGNDYYFIVMNMYGDEVGRIEATNNNASYYDLSNLFDLAKRKALNIDMDLMSIDSYLDSLL